MLGLFGITTPLRSFRRSVFTRVGGTAPAGLDPGGASCDACARPYSVFRGGDSDLSRAKPRASAAVGDDGPYGQVQLWSS